MPSRSDHQCSHVLTQLDLFSLEVCWWREEEEEGEGLECRQQDWKLCREEKWCKFVETDCH